MIRDLRYALRGLLRSPGFALAAILTLALGIGATTAIYSLVDQVILHALLVREPERLVLVDWNGDDLITYATGAPAESTDRPQVDAIVTKARDNHYGFRTLIPKITESPLFLEK